jgi:hypothetical protein
VSTFFFLLAIAAYGWYAHRPEWKRMSVAASLLVLALASKPMVVTLPFVLLLLDYWPLKRIQSWTEPSAVFPVSRQTVWELLLEKVPLFLLAAAGSVVTFFVQRSDGAVRSFDRYPLTARLGNALDGYAAYIGKTLWPANFSIHYPYPGAPLMVWKPLLATVFLCAISVAIWHQRKVRPCLLVGWLWFLGTLVPVIGLVQVGDQAMADRYAYVPLIGLFLTAAWSVAELFKLQRGRSIAWIIAGLSLGLSAFLTVRELGHWQDSVSVWSHAEQVAADSATVEKYLGQSYEEIGDAQSAVPHLIKAEMLDPASVLNHVNLGALRVQEKQIEDAIPEFETAIQLTGRRQLTQEERRLRTAAFLNLGFAYGLLRDYGKALASLREANQHDPRSIDETIDAIKGALLNAPSEGGYVNLFLLLRASGRGDEASLLLESTVQANPEFSEVRELLNYSKMTSD